MLERFRNTSGFGAIVLSPFVAGVGLTLVEANHVIHYGRWWNPAVEGQATDRAFRIGQTRTVHVYFPMLTDPTGEIAQTFDEALDVLISSRRGLATDFLSPVSEEDDAARLFATIRGPKSVPGDREPRQATRALTAESVSGMLLASAEGRGEKAVWLGEDGRLGANVLCTRDGALVVIRVVEQATDGEAGAALDAAAAWGRVVLSRTVVPLLACRVGRSQLRVGQVTWESVADGASTAGISVDDGYAWLVATTDVVRIREVLGI